MSDQKQPFTKEEQEIMDLIVAANNKFVNLKYAHPDDPRDWANAIHALQNILIYRVVKRDYPQTFR